MLRIEVGPGDLAASRFAIAPLGELGFLLRRLDERAGAGGDVATARWARRYLPVRDDLDERVLRALRPRGWGVDLIAPPPAGAVRTLDDDLETVRATPHGVARKQIQRALAATGPVDEDVRAVLDRPDVTAWLADALHRVWHLLLAPDWSRLLAVAERDILHRGDRLVHGGWAAALDGLHPALAWADGAVTVRGRPAGVVQLDGRGLQFVPSVLLHTGPVTYTEPPWRPTVVYPARGSAALWETVPTAPAALARLLGASRAELLLRLAAPATTTQLARLTGQSPGAVGDHLRVLRDADLVGRARVGRSVVYRRTPLGDAVVAGASS